MHCRALFFLCAPALFGQEAGSGVDLQATITGQAVYSHELTQPPRNGRPLVEGLRAVLYPVWKLGGNWNKKHPIRGPSRSAMYPKSLTSPFVPANRLTWVISSLTFTVYIPALKTDGRKEVPEIRKV